MAKKNFNPKNKQDRQTDLPTVYFLLALGTCLFVGLGLAWLGKTAGPEEAAAGPYFILDYMKGLPSGWTPNYLLGHSAPIMNVSFFSFSWISIFQVLLSPPFSPLSALKIASLSILFASAVSMAFLAYSLSRDLKVSAVAGFFYVTMPSLIVRGVLYEHIAVSMAFVFVPLLLRGVWVLTQVHSPREVVLLGLAAAGLSLSYTKMAVTLMPLLMVWTGFCLSRARSSRLLAGISYLAALGLACVAGLTILLPALAESRWAALFALDPLEGWQRHYSFKTALSWIDLGKHFLAQAGPDFEGDAQYFFIGAVPLILISLALGLRRLEEWRRGSAGSWFLTGLTCWLLSLWMASGPWGILGGHLYLLSSAQNLADYALPLIWFVFFWILWMVWKTLREITHQGRVIPALGSLVFVSLPIFPLLAKIPFFGDVRAPESFWSTAGFACLALASAFATVALGTRLGEGRKSWKPAFVCALLPLYLAHYYPVYRHYWSGGLSPEILADYRRACQFLEAAPQPGRVHPLSSRYFYLSIPQITQRGLSTEAAWRHFQLKWVRHFEVASQASLELFQKYLDLAGVAYLFIDKSDPSIAPPVIEAYRQIFPPVFESNAIIILENRGNLFPGFLAQDFVTYPASSYEQAPVILQLAELNFLAVEMPTPDPGTTGLAGVAKGEGEVELMPAYRDRTGKPFVRVSLAAPRQSHFGSIQLNLPQAHGGGWLAVAEAWHPDWRFMVNGVPTPATRVAGALLGAKIQPGQALVEFRFQQPRWYLLSLGLGVFAWFSLLGLLIVTPMRWFPSGFRHWWNGQSFDLEEVTPRYRDGNGPGRSESKKGGTGNPQKILVILPTYNEAETIQQVLEEVQAKAPGTEILVVDDNSPDGTAAKVKQTPNFGKKVHLLERPGKAGLGSAYKEGFQWALKRGYDAVVEMDADLSHDPADVPKLLQALADGADMAVGSRYLNGVRVLNWPQSRLWVSSFGGWYARMLTGLPMTDPTSGFKAIRRRVLEGLDWDKFTAQGYGFQIEIHFLAWQGGFRIQEVPIVFTERREGQSKMSLQIAQEAALRVLQLALRRIFP